MIRFIHGEDIHTKKDINQGNRYIKNQIYRGIYTRKYIYLEEIYAWRNKYIKKYTYGRAIYMKEHKYKKKNTQREIFTKKAYICRGHILEATNILIIIYKGGIENRDLQIYIIRL